MCFLQHIVPEQKYSLQLPASITSLIKQFFRAAPVSYSDNTEIPTNFIHEANGTIGFAVDAYDKTKALTIDLLVTGATYDGVGVISMINSYAVAAAAMYIS